MRFDKKHLEMMIDTSDVFSGYNYWFDKLLAYCLNIFKYKDLPDSLPSKEIESNLILTGHCTIFPDSKGNPVTSLTELAGFDKYYNPTYTPYAQPRLGSGTVYFDNHTEFYIPLGTNKKGCVIYNCDLQNSVLGMPTDGSLYTYIGRYARQLADVESTISNRLVNIRDSFIPVADKESVKKSVQTFFTKRILGKREIVVDSSIAPNLKTIDIKDTVSNDKIYDLLISRDKILECFYREIGVKFYQPKKAQVNEEEMIANDSMLVISLDDLLEERRKGIEKFNKMFGFNATVDINEKFRNDEREVKEDEEIL